MDEENRKAGDAKAVELNTHRPAALRLVYNVIFSYVSKGMYAEAKAMYLGLSAKERTDFDRVRAELDDVVREAGAHAPTAD